MSIKIIFLMGAKYSTLWNNQFNTIINSTAPFTWMSSVNQVCYSKKCSNKVIRPVPAVKAHQTSGSLSSLAIGAFTTRNGIKTGVKGNNSKGSLIILYISASWVRKFFLLSEFALDTSPFPTLFQRRTSQNVKSVWSSSISSRKMLQRWDRGSSSILWKHFF